MQKSIRDGKEEVKRKKAKEKESLKGN